MKRLLNITLWPEDRRRTCAMADPAHPEVIEAGWRARYEPGALSMPDRLLLASQHTSYEYLCSDAITTEEAAERLRLMRREIKRRNALDAEREEETDDD